MLGSIAFVVGLVVFMSMCKIGMDVTERDVREEEEERKREYLERGGFRG